MSLAEALKNRNKKIKINSNVENTPAILAIKNGDDRSFWSGTYFNVKILYDRATFQQLLKDDDKDNYLVDKFLDNGKWFAGAFLGNFIVDRMIAAIFL